MVFQNLDASKSESQFRKRAAASFNVLVNYAAGSAEPPKMINLPPLLFDSSRLPLFDLLMDLEFLAGFG